jgi:hypothetical protein
VCFGIRRGRSPDWLRWAAACCCACWSLSTNKGAANGEERASKHKSISGCQVRWYQGKRLRAVLWRGSGRGGGGRRGRRGDSELEWLGRGMARAKRQRAPRIDVVEPPTDFVVVQRASRIDVVEPPTDFVVVQRASRDDVVEPPTDLVGQLRADPMVPCVSGSGSVDIPRLRWAAGCWAEGAVRFGDWLGWAAACWPEGAVYSGTR